MGQQQEAVPGSLKALSKATGIGRGSSRAQEVAQHVFDTTFDGLMGVLGLPANDSRASQWGELLAAGAPLVAGLRAAKAIGPVQRFVKGGASDLASYHRAAEQGYGPTMYHETAAVNEPTLMRDGFELSRGRARLSDEQMPDGVFMKPDPGFINLTAHQHESLQVPLRHRARNLAEFSDRGALVSRLNQDDVYRQLATDSKQYDAAMSRKFDDMWNNMPEDAGVATPEGRSLSEIKSDALDAFIAEWTSGVEQRATAARARATQVLKDAGHEGVRVRSDAGSFGRNVDTTVIFDPKMVRSEFARFDPAKMDSKSLLASVVAPMGVGLAAASQRRSQAQQGPGKPGMR